MDLAGSEYAGRVSAGNARTEKEQGECRAINKSLDALKGCYRTFAEGTRYRTAFRQSKLTMLLRDHFESPTTQTMMIAAMSPSVFHFDKTIRTLQYGQMVALS